MDVSLDELRKLYHVVSVVDFGLHTLARVLSQMYPATRGIKVTYGHRHKQQWNHGILRGKKVSNQSCITYGFERYQPSRGTVAPSQCYVWADTVWINFVCLCMSPIHFVQHIYRSLCIHRTLVTYFMEFSFHEKAWQQCSVGSSSPDLCCCVCSPCNTLFFFMNQVVLAYGAESDRSLKIPGEVCNLSHEPTQIECSLTHTTFPSIADLSSEIFLAFPILLFYTDGWVVTRSKKKGWLSKDRHPLNLRSFLDFQMLPAFLWKLLGL